MNKKLKPLSTSWGWLMLDSIEFARYIIARANQTQTDPIQIDEAKLHKLVYICDGYLCAAGIKLMRESPRAWNFGPIYPRLHKHYRQVAKPCKETTIKELNKANVMSVVDKVLTTYGNQSNQALALWSIRPGSPWQNALERAWGSMNSPINKNDMQAYFQGLLNENKPKL
jgi:uncharacterized phage-associated protein